MKKFRRAFLALFAIQFLTLPPSGAANQAAEDWKRYLVAAPKVVYPSVIWRTGTQGSGTFLLSIDPKNGTVTKVKVLKSTGFKSLDALYVLNLFQWKFRPGTITSAKIPRGVHLTGRRIGRELY